MDCVNLRDPKVRISCGAAVRVGRTAAFTCRRWPRPSALLDEWLALPAPSGWRRSPRTSSAARSSGDEAAGILRAALDFLVPPVALEPGVRVLELFHGPTLAFRMSARASWRGPWRPDASDSPPSASTRQAG
jgi:hypothetical protein